MGCVENSAGGSELYRYASVASLGGASTMLAVDAYMVGGGVGAGVSAQPTPLAASAATILKISHTGSVSGGGSKGSNVNSPHKQQLGAPQRDNVCGCFSSGRNSGGAGGEDAGGDKQQLPALTFWPALFANLGICTLLLGYLFIGEYTVRVYYCFCHRFFFRCSFFLSICVVGFCALLLFRNFRSINQWIWRAYLVESFDGRRVNGIW